MLNILIFQDLFRKNMLKTNKFISINLRIDQILSTIFSTLCFNPIQFFPDDYWAEARYGNDSLQNVR